MRGLSLVAASGGPLFITVCGPLTIVASLVAERRLQTRRLSSCGSRAQLLRGMWDLPRPGLEPMCPASAGRFLTTTPPGKPKDFKALTSCSCSEELVKSSMEGCCFCISGGRSEVTASQWGWWSGEKAGCEARKSKDKLGPMRTKFATSFCYLQTP